MKLSIVSPLLPVSSFYIYSARITRPIFEFSFHKNYTQADLCLSNVDLYSFNFIHMTIKWFLYYFHTNFILFYANCFIQALRRRHHTVGSNQSNAIEEAKKINQMNRDKRHQTIDNSQSVSNTLLQVWSTAIQSV